MIDKILSAVKALRVASALRISLEANIDYSAVVACLNELAARGELHKNNRGMYQLATQYEQSYQGAK